MGASRDIALPLGEYRFPDYPSPLEMQPHRLGYPFPGFSQLRSKLRNGGPAAGLHLLFYCRYDHSASLYRNFDFRILLGIPNYICL